jgi:hypothetical protein
VIVACALAIIAISTLPAWLLHVRNVGGHGLTEISVVWSAWEGRSVPFLPLAIVIAACIAALSVMGLARPRRVHGTWTLGAVVGCAGVLIGSAIPLSRQGYASSVQLTPHWALLLAVGLSLLAFAGATLEAGRHRAALLACAALVVVAAGTFGGRVVALDWAEGNPRHWADGSYVRDATGGQPSETLVISNGTFTIGERWSGVISGRGLVAVLTEDPACPGDRGAYRVFAAGGEDIEWNLIVDLCADGGRAADLTTGIWHRQP